jgi:hypothetical protein
VFTRVCCMHAESVCVRQISMYTGIQLDEFLKLLEVLPIGVHMRFMRMGTNVRDPCSHPLWPSCLLPCIYAGVHTLRDRTQGLPVGCGAASVGAYARLCPHASPNLASHPCLCLHTHTQTRARAHTHTHAYTHTRIHTHGACL